MKWVLFVFLGLYAVAVSLLVIGTFGLLGQERDPLSGIFLLPLGLPWNLLGDRLGLEGPWVAILAPAVNAVLLLLLWRRAASAS